MFDIARQRERLLDERHDTVRSFDERLDACELLLEQLGLSLSEILESQGDGTWEATFEEVAEEEYTGKGKGRLRASASFKVIPRK